MASRIRLWPLIALVVILSMILAACAPVSPVAPAAPAEEKPAVEEKPTVAEEKPAAPAEEGGGTLIGAFDVGPGGCPQCIPYFATAGHTWLMKIWTPLVSWNADVSGLVPQLATSWESNEDATVWTFHLRDGVKWHDGEPFTAEDVKFTLELAWHPDSGARITPAAKELVGWEAYSQRQADEISGVKVIDDLTVQFELTQPDARFPYQMVQAYILPKHALEDLNPADMQTTDWWWTNPIGTGPFKFSSYEKDQFMELVPNPDYWNGKPKLEKLINRYFADETSAVLALESGDIDFTYVSGDVALRLQDDPKYQVFSGPSFVTNYLIFNHRNPAFQDKRVRQAFLYAIDREAITQEVLKGTAMVVPCIAPDPNMWPEEYNKYPYDPAKAKQLLDEGGWDYNFEFEAWTYYTSQFHKDALQAIQAYLADVGVKMTPRFMDVPAYNAEFYTGKGWDVSYRGLGVNIGSYPWNFYLSDGFPGAEGGSLSGYKNPDFDAMLKKAQAEIDPDAYLQDLREICRFQNEEALEGYMWTSIRFGAAATHVKDFYWFPAPGGGPYEDHPETWYVQK